METRVPVSSSGSPSRVKAKDVYSGRVSRAVLVVCLSLLLHTGVTAQIRLATEADRAAFRSWFVLLADAQFAQPAPEVIDCAALVRFAFREALRPHNSDWWRRLGLPPTPSFPDVKSAPQPRGDLWPLFRVSAGELPRYAEFADARTIINLNTRAIGRDTDALVPGDLLYFRQPEQRQPDHLMVFIGRSLFEPAGDDWVVYHTGPIDGKAGEIRKVRLADLQKHPSPRWRPTPANPAFTGVFRLTLL